MTAPANGPSLFARYAYPPNELGYCGPEEPRSLLAHAAEGAPEHADEELLAIARGFDGAWPYLQLLAGANGVGDPLDPRVVEAYWVGSDLLGAVPPAALAQVVGQQPTGRHAVGVAALEGAAAHHSFHVLAVYPWLGLLRAGTTEPSLRVLERCLIRWGTVRSIAKGEAEVDVVTLAWDGSHLSLGPPRTEPFHAGGEGHALAVAVGPGDTVAVHWDWVCDRLAPAALDALWGATARTLELVDPSVRRPAPKAT